MPAAKWKVFRPRQPRHDEHDSASTTPNDQNWPKHEKSSLTKPQGPDDVDHPEFDEDSKWPRRLLNVKNMTSYQWQPGNIYGCVPNPGYSIISYTWGKWRIRDSNSKVEALSVHGVPWDMPKVEPVHFTAQQLKHILEQIVDFPVDPNTPGSGARTIEERSPFVWLDVACLSQSEDSPTANSEVGRQARIFRNATKAYIWLTTVDLQEVTTLFQGIFNPDLRDAKNDLAAFCKLLADPWFKSMWTMQEAFIKQTAYIVTNFGFCLLNDKARHKRHTLELSQIRGFAVYYSPESEYERKVLLRKAGKDYLNFQDLWFKTGLHGPLAISPMQVIACASHRKCEFEHDRVYGIMQVFGDEFKVGKARPESKNTPKRTWTLLELQDELGTLILRNYPTIGQLFQHEEPPRMGRAWRVCRRAIVPPLLGGVAESFNESLVHGNPGQTSPDPPCRLGTEAVGSSVWATFDGRLCPFERILECSNSSSFTTSLNRFHVYLDAGTTFDTSHLASDRFDATPDNIIEHFGGDNLMVLLLSSPANFKNLQRYSCSGVLLVRPGQGSLDEQGRREDWEFETEHVGLQWWDFSLQPIAREAWARVGVIQWIWFEEENEGPHTKTLEMDTLLGNSKDWTPESGRWG